MMLPENITEGRWHCDPSDGSSTVLREHERMERPPHYVICPDCETHWIAYQDQDQRKAMPVIVPVGA